MAYLAAKHLHVAFVALSFIGFFVRGILMLSGSSLSRSRFARIAPHIVDTLLLVTALYLAYVVLQSPGDHAWLVSKFLGLVLYIVLGVFALRRGKTRTARLVFWLLGLLVFCWIGSVAFSKNALGFLSALT